MPRFAFLARFDGAPVDTAGLASFVDRLAGGGPRPQGAALDRSWLAARALRRPADAAPPAAALAFRPESGLVAAFDGRLDNRAELLDLLAIADAELRRTLPDAALVAAGYERLGEAIFGQLLGPYVALVAHEADRWLRLARDPLGGRRLFWRRAGGALLVASRPSALAARDRAGLDESSMARFLALRGPAPGRTFFRDVEELPPGAVVRADAAGVRTVRTLELAPAPPPRRERDAEARLRELLDRAVACRLEADGSAAVAMSGGLDSTAIAATAARLAAVAGAPRPLAVSWVFRELRDADESRWIDAMARALPIEPRPIVADDLGPLRSEPEASGTADSPFREPYWALRERTFRAALDGGRRALLTGDSGDQLWAGGRDWLRDLLRTGRLPAAFAGVAEAARRELRGDRLAHPLRTSLGRFAGGVRLPHRPEEAPWLTPEGHARLGDARAEADDGCLARLLLPFHLEHLDAAREHASDLGLELRSPWRDRRLVELFLGLPARRLYRPGETKRLLRRGLADRVPAAVRQRTEATSMVALFERGLSGAALERVRASLAAPDANWRRWVREEWLSERAFSPVASEERFLPRVVLWHCFRLEEWRRTVENSASYPQPAEADFR